jgi:hypothetical protein
VDSSGHSGDTGSRRRSSITRILTAEEEAGVLEGRKYEEGTGSGEEKDRERVEQFVENLEQVPEGDETDRQDRTKEIFAGGGNRGSFSEDSLGEARGSEMEAGAGSWTNATQELPPGDLRQIDTSTAGQQVVNGGNGLDAAASDPDESGNKPQEEKFKGPHAGISAHEQDAVLTICGQEGTALLTVDDSTVGVSTPANVQTGAQSTDQLRTAKVAEKIVETSPDREGETGGVLAGGCEGSLGEGRVSDPGGGVNPALSSAEGGMSERALVVEEPEEVDKADPNGGKETPGQTELKSLEEQTEAGEAASEGKELAEDSTLEDDGEKTSAWRKGSLETETSLAQEANGASQKIVDNVNELEVDTDLERNGASGADEHLQEEEAEGQERKTGERNVEESSLVGGANEPEEDKCVEEESLEEQAGTDEDGTEQGNRIDRKESPQERESLTETAVPAVEKGQEDSKSSRGGDTTEETSQMGQSSAREEHSKETATQRGGFEVSGEETGREEDSPEIRSGVKLQNSTECPRVLVVDDDFGKEVGEVNKEERTERQNLSVKSGFNEQKSLAVPVPTVDGEEQSRSKDVTGAEMQKVRGKGGGLKVEKEPKAGGRVEASVETRKAALRALDGMIAAEIRLPGEISESNVAQASKGRVEMVTSGPLGPLVESESETRAKDPPQVQVVDSIERPESNQLPYLKGEVDAREPRELQEQGPQPNRTSNGGQDATRADMNQLPGAKQGGPVMDNTDSEGVEVTKPSHLDRKASLTGARRVVLRAVNSEGGVMTEVGASGKATFPQDSVNGEVRGNAVENLEQPSERRATELADGSNGREVERSPAKGKKHKKKRRATSESVAEAPGDVPPASGEPGKRTAGESAPSSKGIEGTTVGGPAELISVEEESQGRVLKVVPGGGGDQDQVGNRAEFSQADYQDSRPSRAGPSRKGESRLLISAEEELDTVPDAVALKAKDSLAPLEDGHEKPDKGKKRKGKKSRRGSEEGQQSQQPEHSDPAAVELSESSSKDDVQIQSVEQTAGAGTAADGKKKKGKKSRRGSEEKGTSQHWEQSGPSGDGLPESSAGELAKGECAGQDSGEPLGLGETSQLDGTAAEGKKKKKSKGLRKKRLSEDQSLEEKGKEGTRKERQAGASTPDTAKEGREKEAYKVDEGESGGERVGAERGAERLARASGQKQRNGSAEIGGVEVVDWHEIGDEEVEANEREGAVLALPSFGVKEQRRVHGKEERGGMSATNEEQSDVDGLTMKGEPSMNIDGAGQTETGSHVAAGVVRKEEDRDCVTKERGSDDVGEKLKLALAGRKGKRGSTGSLYYPEQALGAASVSPGHEEAVRKPAQTGQSEPAQVRRVLILF